MLLRFRHFPKTLAVSILCAGVAAQADSITISAIDDHGHAWPTFIQELRTVSLNTPTRGEYQTKLNDYCKSKEVDTTDIEETCVAKTPLPAKLFTFVNGQASVAVDKALDCSCTSTAKPKPKQDASRKSEDKLFLELLDQALESGALSSEDLAVILQ